jgi:hypothetical protein
MLLKTKTVSNLSAKSCINTIPKLHECDADGFKPQRDKHRLVVCHGRVKEKALLLRGVTYPGGCYCFGNHAFTSEISCEAP